MKITQVNNCKCLICGIEFRVKPSRLKNGMVKYCSVKCRREGIKKPIERKCKQCGTIFKTIPSQINIGKGIYCSPKCQYEALSGEGSYHWNGGRQSRICLYCGNEFLAQRSRSQSYCSSSCHGKTRVGSLNPSWKGGISSRNMEYRMNNYAKDWSIKVYKKDGYTCQRCGKKNVKLHAHHIIPWVSDESLRYDMSNGITLCSECHYKEHSRLSKLAKHQRDLFDASGRK